ncbi:MAG: hypothetical protein Q9220_004573 [cf. Caloplaca sp. 1 TL-2023]
MAPFILDFLYKQLFITPPLPATSFANQTIIVTGSNTGLGLEAVRHLARLGASKIIIAVRNTEKGEVAKRSVEESTGCSKEVLEVWPLDLTSYASVKAFAERASRELERLDVLIANAGMMTQRWQMAEEDEITITTNVTSTFLLGMMLLPKLQETGKRFNVSPRLVVTSSDLHFITTMTEERKGERIFERLNEEKGANMNDRSASYL